MGGSGHCAQKALSTFVKLYIVTYFYANKCLVRFKKHFSHARRYSDSTNCPILTSGVLSNFGAIKDVTDFLVNVFFSTLQLELLWGNQICHQESW